MSKFVAVFYILVLLLELLVMFSRVMLGMHSLNEVLFGLSIGLFSFIPYYLFIEAFIMKLILKIFANQGSMITNIGLVVAVILFWGIELIVALVPTYDNEPYWNVIKHTPGCEHAKLSTAFQYSCLIGTSIISAGFGVVLGLNYMQKPYNLARLLSYSRLSIKFIARLLLTIVVAAIPLVLFLNPLWHEIRTDDIGTTMIAWTCNNLAFFLATFLILYMSPILGEKLGLEGYKHPSSYADFKRFEVINMLDYDNGDVVIVTNNKPRETEMTDPRYSDFGSKILK